LDEIDEAPACHDEGRDSVGAYKNRPVRWGLPSEWPRSTECMLCTSSAPADRRRWTEVPCCWKSCWVVERALEHSGAWCWPTPWSYAIWTSGPNSESWLCWIAYNDGVTSSKQVPLALR